MELSLKSTSLLRYLQNFITLETLEQERVLFFNNCTGVTLQEANEVGHAFWLRKVELQNELRADTRKFAVPASEYRSIK